MNMCAYGCDVYSRLGCTGPLCIRPIISINIMPTTVLTYRSLNGSAPSYLSSYFTRVADVPSRHWFRSASTSRLTTPFIRRSTVGKRSFPVAGADLWNELPADVTSAPSLPVFRQRLKTFLFRRSYPGIVV